MTAVGVLQAPVLGLAGPAVMWAVKSSELRVTAIPSPWVGGSWQEGEPGGAPSQAQTCIDSPDPKTKARGLPPRVSLQQSLRHGAVGARGTGQDLHTLPGAETPHFPDLTMDKDKPRTGASRPEF